jgi:hypothetical protein
MDIFIRFIGLMLIVQMNGTGPYHAIIPKWVENETFCDGQYKIMPHAAYIRVQNEVGQVKDDTKWTKDSDCDAILHCRLYKIPVDSTLAVDGGFTPTKPTNPPDLPCFVPHLKNEKLVTSDALHADVFKGLSIVDFEIPPGELSAGQFTANDMIFVEARLQAPPGTKNHDITVTATPRDGSAARVLVVAPGTIIDLIDSPVDYAAKDYSTVISAKAMEGHFYFLRKLLADPGTVCKPVPGLPPAGCMPNKRDHKGGPATTLNLQCGPGGP